MNTVFTKLKDFVGFNEQQEDDYNYLDGEEMEGNDYAVSGYYTDETPAAPEDDRTAARRRQRAAGAAAPVGDVPRAMPGRDRFVAGGSAATASGSAGSSSGPMGNVIGLPTAQAGLFEVVVIEPRSFEKMPQVIQALRDRKSVILNLTAMEPEEAQRAVDFVAGGTYAIDGHQERVGESIFLFTPNCVQVTTQAGVIHEVAHQVKEQSAGTGATPSPAWALDDMPDSIAQ